MKLSFTFEPQFSNWSVQQIFNRYYKWFVDYHREIDCTHIDTARLDKSNPSGVHSPHLMTIRNLDNQKYILVSYWDKAVELTWNGNGWDYENCVDIITSSGVSKEVTNFTPSSYSTYSLDFEKDSEKYRIPFNEKKNSELTFRGFLYGMRYELNKLNPKLITNKKIPSYEAYGCVIGQKQICNNNRSDSIKLHNILRIFKIGITYNF